MQLQSDDFELFGLPRRFAQDDAVLAQRWKDLQREAHPDRFRTQGAAAQRLAMQWSVRINEAYQRLRQPLQRAAYLCELMGVPVRAHDNTAMPVDFLMQQMTWREALDEADKAPAIQALLKEVQQSRQERMLACAHWLDEQADAQQAALQVRALMFVEKMLRELENKLDTLTTA
jgi:molecular chaperone HscB